MRNEPGRNPRPGHARIWVKKRRGVNGFDADDQGISDKPSRRTCRIRGLLRKIIFSARQAIRPIFESPAEPNEMPAMTLKATENFISPLPLDTCCRMLAAKIDGPWTLNGKAPLIGWLKGARLRVRRRLKYNNSFQTYLSATLSAEGDATLIRCRFGLHPLVKVYMIIWFAGAIVAFTQTIVAILRGHPMDPHRLPVDQGTGVAGPVALLILGCGVVWVARYLARNERDDLLGMVSDILQARRRT